MKKQIPWEYIQSLNFPETFLNLTTFIFLTASQEHFYVRKPELIPARLYVQIKHFNAFDVQDGSIQKLRDSNMIDKNKKFKNDKPAHNTQFQDVDEIVKEKEKSQKGHHSAQKNLEGYKEEDLNPDLMHKCIEKVM